MTATPEIVNMASPPALKKTPFDSFHRKLGAKMVPFAGYDMPIQYTGMTEEHVAVRRNVGLFDLSHMGEFVVRGSAALAFLQRVTSNDVSALAIGQAQYSGMLNERGGFVDDLLVYHAEDHYFLVVNASNITKDFAWLSSHLAGDVTLEDLSDEYGLLAVQGPNATRVMSALTPFDLSVIAYYHHAMVPIAGRRTLVSRTGYTGEDGFEIYLRVSQAAEIWEAVTRAGMAAGMTHIGLGARDTLRLEMKMALYGNDIDDTTSALEAGLGWVVKFEKGEFIGRKALLEQKSKGVSRKLVCIEFADRIIPRHGYVVMDDSGRPIGAVTSGAYSPSLSKPIALAYVPAEQSKVGQTVMIEARGKLFAGVIVKAPFYKDGSHL